MTIGQPAAESDVPASTLAAPSRVTANDDMDRAQ
jgi:hypothetical protein